MPANFPNSPSVNDEYTFNGTTWVWTGDRWETVSDFTDITVSNITVTDNTIANSVNANTFTGGSFIGDGSDLTDVRAETLEVTIKNVSGSSIAKGYPVHQTGSTGGGTPEVVPADAGNAQLMPAHFIAGETLGIDAEGRGILAGELSGIDTATAGFSVGDVIYVAVGGGYANVAPTGEANFVQNLGIVTRVDATVGGGEVYGAGRTAATPNLNSGNIFIGDAQNAPTTQNLGSAINTVTAQLNRFTETVQNLGNVSGTITPDIANGSIITATLTGNITLNSLTNATSGISATLVLSQDGTGSRILSSTMKFLGGDNVLSTGASNVDIISVFYDGSDYYASITKDYK